MQDAEPSRTVIALLAACVIVVSVIVFLAVLLLPGLIFDFSGLSLWLRVLLGILHVVIAFLAGTAVKSFGPDILPRRYSEPLNEFIRDMKWRTSP